MYEYFMISFRTENRQKVEENVESSIPVSETFQPVTLAAVSPAEVLC